MKFVYTVFLLLAAASAGAQTEVGCVLDRELRDSVCSLGGGDGASGMKVSGNCLDAIEQSYVVFMAADFPAAFSSVTLPFVAKGPASC